MSKYKVYDVIEEDISLDDTPPAVTKSVHVASKVATPTTVFQAASVVQKIDDRMPNNSKTVTNSAPVSKPPASKYKSYDVIEEDINLDNAAPAVVAKKAPEIKLSATPANNASSTPAVTKPVIVAPAVVQKKDDRIPVSHKTTMNNSVVNKPPASKYKSYDAVEEDIDLDNNPPVVAKKVPEVVKDKPVPSPSHTNIPTKSVTPTMIPTKTPNTVPAAIPTKSNRWDDIHKDRSAISRPETKTQNIDKDSNKAPHVKTHVVNSKSNEPKKSQVVSNKNQNNVSAVSNMSLDKDSKAPPKANTVVNNKPPEPAVVHAPPTPAVNTTAIPSKSVSASSTFICQGCKTVFAPECSCTDFPCPHVQQCSSCRGGVTSISTVRETVVKKKKGWDEDSDSD
jgi:hypothetical protein